MHIYYFGINIKNRVITSSNVRVGLLQIFCYWAIILITKTSACFTFGELDLTESISRSLLFCSRRFIPSGNARHKGTENIGYVLSWNLLVLHTLQTVLEAYQEYFGLVLSLHESFCFGITLFAWLNKVALWRVLRHENRLCLKKSVLERNCLLILPLSPNIQHQDVVFPRNSLPELRLTTSYRLIQVVILQ